MNEPVLSKATAGVNYDMMDPRKIAAQVMAARTAQNARRLGVVPLEWTRGESVYCFRVGRKTFGTVIEGLGTKQFVADAMREKTTLDMYYWGISQDTIAMNVNDAATLGVFPLVCDMHIAAGSSEWFEDEKRWQAIIYGWKKACDMSGCIYGPGESSSLRDLVVPDSFEISGAMFGLAKYGLLNPKNIRDGDAIVFLTSSGIHANGLTDARDLAAKLPKGYLTELPSGRPYGDALLVPTHIYCTFVESCRASGVDLHYGVNITGHGWGKLMRPTQSFSYIVENVPPVPEVLEFIQGHLGMDDKKAYGTFNMGAGFALYLPQAQVETVIALAEEEPFKAMYGGNIKDDGKRRVVIKPKDVEYDTLGVR